MKPRGTNLNVHCNWENTWVYFHRKSIKIGANILTIPNCKMHLRDFLVKRSVVERCHESELGFYRRKKDMIGREGKIKEIGFNLLCVQCVHDVCFYMWIWNGTATVVEIRKIHCSITLFQHSLAKDWLLNTISESVNSPWSMHLMVSSSGLKPSKKKTSCHLGWSYDAGSCPVMMEK